MERPRNCWHICTEGLEDKLLFRDREDFIYGINGVALCSVTAPVAILAFCLMDNHVHFVVNGSEDRCRHFIKSFVARLAQHLRKKYNEYRPLAGINITMKILDSYVYLKNVIVYVHRNPLAAGVCVPNNYEWSSASVPFRPRSTTTLAGSKTMPVTSSGKAGRRENGNRGVRSCEDTVAGQAGMLRVGDLSPYVLRGLLKTRMTKLPPDWIINDEGMILPECYVLVGFVEKQYATPASYMYAMGRNNDAQLETELAVSREKAFGDVTLKSLIPTICAEEFGVDKFDKLDVDEKCRLVILMRKRYGAGLKQLARITCMDLMFLRNLFGRKDY